MKENSFNSFNKGMYLDSIPSMQPDGTYRTAVNAVVENHDFNSFGLGNEPSNELCFKVPDGYKICGWGFIEERDQFLIFSHNEDTNVSQIGIGDTKSCEYKIVIEDKDPERFLNKFCFSTSEKINPTFKHLRPCNDLWVYWSNNFTYYRLNLDGDLCDIKYEDIILFDCKCPAVIDSFVINDGGDLLDVGAYQFACQLIDDDNNRTNWFRINNPVYLTSEDNKRGDKSDKAVLIEIDNLPKSFPKVAIAVVKTVGGIQTAEVITQLYHNGKKITYIYRGKDRDDEVIDVQEILSRRTGFIQGRDLIQRDGRLFLYNLKEEWNLNAQKYVNKIKANFVVGKIPASEAHRTLTLPRGEVLSLAAVYNYCDGTSSVGFHIPGRIGSPDDFTKIPTDNTNNCTECEKFKWEVENTAYIEENFCSSSVYELGLSTSATEPKYRPERTLYIKIDPAKLKLCKNNSSTTESLHLSGGCGGGGDCSSGCNGGQCIEGSCTEGTCPSTGLSCSQCSVCNGSYSTDDCDDPEEGGVECYECHENNFPSADVVKGLVSCPEGGECIDGICSDTGLPCDFCSTCGGGEYFIKVTQGSNYTEEIPLASEFDGCPEGEPIYDDEGCRIIGYKPALVAKGKFGYWESSELYPKTKDCDGNYIYEELAGQPIRHHLVPDESLIPFANSKVDGVVCPDNPDNFEWQNTDVFVIGLDLCNVELPPNPPKPYCPFNPVSIFWQTIDPKERRVNARGLITHTFLGNVRNKQYAVPKNAVNSLEYYDRHLNTEYAGIEKFRGGEGIGLPIYNFHSPDTQFQKIPLTADRLLVPYEVNGKGKRYGIYAEGEEPLNMWHTTTNTKGARQAINLNKRTLLSGRRVVTKPARCQREFQIEVELTSCKTTKLGEFGFRTIALIFNIFELKERVESFTVTGTVKTNRRTIPFSRTIRDNNKGGYSVVVQSSESTISADFTIDILIKNGKDFCRYQSSVSLNVNAQNCKAKTTINSGRSQDWQNEEVIELPAVDKRCIKAISYAKKDSIVDKENKFSYSLLNLKRESSVYLEVEGDSFGLSNPIDLSLSDGLYNGKESNADGTSDGSFIGDVYCHTCPIYNAAGHHAILLNDSPNQYGRIESATYIPLGFDFTGDEVICKSAYRFNIGDSYVGLYSFRRYSEVSDKIGNLDSQIPPETDEWSMNLLLDTLVAKVDRLLCRHDCSKIPDSCINDGDGRKRAALRDSFLSCWDGGSRFPGNTGTDTYHPNTVNTLIHYWTESRINLWNRQTGEADFYGFEFSKNYPTSKGAEVHYPKLKQLALDSNVPEGTPWTKSWLTRIGVQWRTVALLRRIAITVIKLLITFGLPMAFGIALGVPLLLVMLFNDRISLRLCKWLYALFQVRQCRPKCLQGSDNCYITDEDLLPFEDNYTGYNWDFNTKNTLETKIGMPDPYNTCICDVGEGNQIVYSAKQNPLSETDAYKNFLPNSYLNIPADFGKIQSLFLWGNNFFAQTSDIIINIATADGIINLGNGQALEVVTQGGDLRTQPKEIVSGVPEGFAGSRDPNSAINTQFGRFFVDREGKKIFQFSGGLPQEISNFGIRNFLKENLELELHRQFPDYKLVDEAEGIGYRFGFDHRFNKLMFTKIDYKAKFPEKIELFDGVKFYHKELGRFVEFGDEAHFINKSFTLSYDPINKRWISFHTYIPDGYAWDRDHLYSIKDGGFWKHGDKYGEYQMFYNHYYPHAVEFVISKNGIHSQFTDLNIDVESNKFDGNNWINGVRKTFDRGLFYNDKQSTGFIDLVEKNKEDAIGAMKERENEATIEWQTDVVRVNDLVDRVVDPESPIFDGKESGAVMIPNEENIGDKKGKFEGKYLVARLILDDPEATNIQHILKRVITKQDVTIR